MQLIIYIELNKSFYIIDFNNCNYISFIEYINFISKSILPVL